MRRALPALFVAVLLAVLSTAASWSEDQGEQGDDLDVLALGVDVEKALGPPAGPPVTGDALENRTEEVAGALRCTACQGLSVRDSPAETARNMKRQIRAMSAAGYDRAQIEDYFVGAYGEFVLMAPTTEGFNLLVWLLPVAILLVGSGLWIATVRRRNAAPAAAESTGAVDPARDGAGEASVAADPLQPWIERIRAEANED